MRHENYLTFDERLNEVAWIDWTPTVSSAVGTITSYTVNFARYRQYGNLVEYEIDITITDNGTGAGDVRATTPTSTIGDWISSGVARNTTTGKLVQSIVVSSQILLISNSNTYPISSGEGLHARGQYETNQEP